MWDRLQLRRLPPASSKRLMVRTSRETAPAYPLTFLVLFGWWVDPEVVSLWLELALFEVVERDSLPTLRQRIRVANTCRPLGTMHGPKSYAVFLLHDPLPFASALLVGSGFPIRSGKGPENHA